MKKRSLQRLPAIHQRVRDIFQNPKKRHGYYGRERKIDVVSLGEDERIVSQAKEDEEKSGSRIVIQIRRFQI